MADDSIADPPVEVRMRAFDKGEIKPGVHHPDWVPDCLQVDPATLNAPIKTLKDKFELLPAFL